MRISDVFCELDVVNNPKDVPDEAIIDIDILSASNDGLWRRAWKLR